MRNPLHDGEYRSGGNFQFEFDKYDAELVIGPTPWIGLAGIGHLSTRGRRLRYEWRRRSTRTAPCSASRCCQWSIKIERGRTPCGHRFRSASPAVPPARYSRVNRTRTRRGNRPRRRAAGLHARLQAATVCRRSLRMSTRPVPLSRSGGTPSGRQHAAPLDVCRSRPVLRAGVPSGLYVKPSHDGFPDRDRGLLRPACHQNRSIGLLADRLGKRAE